MPGLVSFNVSVVIPNGVRIHFRYGDDLVQRD